MGFLGLDLPETEPHYKAKRIGAFAVDFAVVCGIWFVSYRLTGQPDFYTVK